MFIDDVNNRYVYLNSLKNIVWEEPADRTPYDRNIQVHDAIAPILDRLTKERPTWRFKTAQRFHTSNTICWATNFDIFDGDEALGNLWMDHHWRDGTPRFYFNNFRLEKARQRNGGNFSTKPDVAAKRILKAFHLKTPKERAAEAFATARSAVQKLHADTAWPVRRAKASLEADLLNYAARNWETIKESLPSAKSIDLPALIEAHAESSRLAGAIDQNQFRTVRIEANGTYLVSRPMNDTYEVQTYNDAALPDDLRGALGLLKLVENNGHIDGVGVRVNASLYFVMDK